MARQVPNGFQLTGVHCGIKSDAAAEDMVIASVDALITATNHLMRLAANGNGVCKAS